MADLFPTPTRLALLRDIADGRVADDIHLTPMLDLGDGLRTKVSYGVWEMSQAADEPAECLGSDMDCGRPLPCPDHPATDEPEAVIDPGEGLLT